MLHHKDGVTFINLDDILLVQREDRATVIYTVNDGRYVLSETLSETEARLDPEIFFRCHKSYIINLRRIRNITPYGRWTYVVQLEGTEHDALITHEKYEELEKRFSWPPAAGRWCGRWGLGCGCGFPGCWARKRWG